MKYILIDNNCIEVVDNNGEKFDLININHHEKLNTNFYKFVISNPAPNFSIDELKIMQKLLLGAMEWGDTYPNIKEYVDLFEKISEEIVINS